MSKRSALLLASIFSLAHGCRPLPPAGHMSSTAPNARSAADEAGAALLAASGAPPKASPASTTAGDGGVIEHAVGELPPHNLQNCVPHAGETYRRTTTFKPAPSASDAGTSQVTPAVRRTCSFNSECAARRGQAPGPTDGTVDISCDGEKCTCTVTTYVPAEVRSYTFFESDPCRDIKNLLRKRCGG